jgi:hypothetical protein
MVLNDSLNFENVDPTVRKAFLRAPDKLLIRPGVRLYKWTDRSLIDGPRITPWWSFVESTRLPSGLMADGFRVTEERAARLGKSRRDFARKRSAISAQFGNSMTRLLIIQINQPVWGFAGQASGQPEFAADRPEFRHVFPIGGACQVWVPNLTPIHVTAVPVVG